MMDPNDAPEVLVLWDRAHTARKPRECSMCNEAINPGEKYHSTGMRVDGVFEHFVRHQYGERYPSGCPKLRERDLQDMETEQ